jgi:hypothetical protein
MHIEAHFLELENYFNYENVKPFKISFSLHRGTFTNIRAIGIVTNALFFMFSCHKLY